MLGASSTQQAAKAKKSHVSGGIKIEATATKKITNAEIVAVLKEWITDLESDGRGKQLTSYQVEATGRQ